MSNSFVSRLVGAGALLWGVTGCTFGPQSSLPYMRDAAPLRMLDATGAGKITHVVFIIQENRSFNNLFYGYPGAYTVTTGKNSRGRTVRLEPVSLASQYVIDHSVDAMFAACNGTGKPRGTNCRMNGFNKEATFNGPRGIRYPEYVYVPHKESKPYFDMAHEWVVADNNFQSHLDESFVAHQYAIAAQAQSSVDLPYGLWGCPGGASDEVPTITQKRKFGPNESPCFDYQTLGDELDNAHLTWRFYTSKYGSPSSGDGSYWSAYQAVRHIYEGPDWHKDVITPQKKFITDVAHGKLANFTWITPVCKNSDHVNCGGGFGPSWVASLVNAVGESKFWDTSAIFVTWDDWGGLYDPVPPPYKDYDGLGFRVPLLVISPYAKKNHVSHKLYETTSVLRFAEDLFGLAQLAAADRRALSPAKDCFDFNQAPRPFVPIKAPQDAAFFLAQPSADYFAPDYQ